MSRALRAVLAAAAVITSAGSRAEFATDAEIFAFSGELSPLLQPFLSASMQQAARYHELQQTRTNGTKERTSNYLPSTTSEGLMLLTSTEGAMS